MLSIEPVISSFHAPVPLPIPAITAIAFLVVADIIQRRVCVCERGNQLCRSAYLYDARTQELTIADINAE